MATQISKSKKSSKKEVQTNKKSSEKSHTQNTSKYPKFTVFSEYQITLFRSYFDALFFIFYLNIGFPLVMKFFLSKYPFSFWSTHTNTFIAIYFGLLIYIRFFSSNRPTDVNTFIMRYVQNKVDMSDAMCRGFVSVMASVTAGLFFRIMYNYYPKYLPQNHTFYNNLCVMMDNQKLFEHTSLLTTTLNFMPSFLKQFVSYISYMAFYYWDTLAHIISPQNQHTLLQSFPTPTHTLLGFSSMIDAFISNMAFSGVHIFGQVLGLLHSRTTRGVGYVSLALSTFTIISSRSYIPLTGGVTLNPSTAILLGVYRGDYIGLIIGVLSTVCTSYLIGSYFDTFQNIQAMKVAHTPMADITKSVSLETSETTDTTSESKTSK